MAVMSALVLYIIPGLIGRAYDLKNDTCGPDIFDMEKVKQDARVIDRHMFTSEYKMVTDESEASDFLDVSGKLALKIKTGAVDVKGSGSYLKGTSSFQNKIELLVKVHYETVAVVLPSFTEPMPDWFKSVEGTSNTHYIRSILYGGDLIASISFLTKNEEDREVIKAAISGEMSTKSGSFGGEVKGNLEKIQNKTKSSSSMEINYFATVPLEDVPRTIDGLTELVNSFADRTKKVNNGWGVPLKMEVLSLESLNKDMKTYYQTLALADMMTVVNEQLTDFRNARRKLSDWMKSVPPILPESENNKIGEFATRLDKLNFVYSDVIGNMDLSSDASPKQFEKAMTEYESIAGYTYPDLYVRELSKLKQDVMEHTESLEADFGGGHFDHWGSDECHDSEVLFKGIMFGSNKESVGSSKISCLSNEKHLYPDEKVEKEKGLLKYPQLQKVVFVSTDKSAKEERLSMKCARCRVPGKSTTTMLPGMNQCPKSWKLEYKGRLVSTDTNNVRGPLICLDASSHGESVSSYDELTVITEVSPMCGEFPCDGHINKKNSIACVVCSIKKETKHQA